MNKAKQRIASIITTISVAGTLMASFPLTTSAAVIDENNDNRATNVKISLEDAANSDLRTVYIQIFTLFKFDKNLKKYNRKTTLFIVK